MKQKKPDEILTELENGLSKKEIVEKLGVSHAAVRNLRGKHPELCLTVKGKKRIAPHPKKGRIRPLLSVRVSPEIFDGIEEAREKKGETRTVFMNNLLEEWGLV